MGKVARVALPIAAIGTGFGLAGMGPMAGMFSGATAGTGASLLPGAMTGGAAVGGPAFATGAAGGLGSWGSAFSLGSMFNKSNLGMLSSGLSSLSSFGAAGAQQDLMAAQQAEIQRQKDLRSLQILQEQREYREKANRIASIARNTMTPGQSKRAFLRDNESRMNEGLSNIGLTGRYDMASFDSDFTQTGIAGRSASYSSFIKGSRSLISGVSNYAKTRTY